MNSSEVTLRRLERDAQADRLVLNNFLARFKESSQESDASSQRPDAQIVSYAQLPVEPERPKKGLLLAIFGVASFLVGTFAVYLVENADGSLHTLQDAEALGLAGLGLIPLRVPPGSRRRKPLASARPTGKRSRPCTRGFFGRVPHHLPRSSSSRHHCQEKARRILH